MRYGFAIDQRTCIGCHACTVACKTEHQVPLGQFRTWVKYVDSGTFPDTSRAFGVMRCNHCTDAPCVTICPTSALFKRPDGIVDFDSERCIGCKSCMQACPYDALYIDKDTNTAAKCNYCAHRVDNGLEPACVIVCPTHSIWSGDLDDPDSDISRLVSSQDTLVRAPEQRTGPNVHYVGASPLVLEPLAAPVRDTYIWAEPDDLRLLMSEDGEPADPTAITTLNTAHDRPWGWRVSTYLWTKGVGAGALLFSAGEILLGRELHTPGDLGPLLALIGIVLTGVLLVWDLKRPERFVYLLTKPQMRSWLVKGGYCLMAISAVGGLWLLAQILGLDRHPVEIVLAVLSIPAAVMAAGYTALLFAQAEGRDLWQSRGLFVHLIAQAVTAGAGALAAVALWGGADPGQSADVARVLVVAMVVQLVWGVVELLASHSTQGAERAARIITRGRYALYYWVLSVGVGLVAAVLALVGWNGADSRQWVVAVAGVLTQVSILTYEFCFVRAGQEVPLS